MKKMLLLMIATLIVIAVPSYKYALQRVRNG
jgi:hypothetical protein